MKPTKLILRDIKFDYENTRYRLWIQDEEFTYHQYFISRGDNLTLNLGEYICIKCHLPVVSLTSSVCDRCVDPDSDFHIRMSCLFDDKTSPLVQQGGCVKDNISCSRLTNRKYCFSQYIVYIGRIGIYIKVGISRKNRRGGYHQRLYEQGLHEAIVITGFDSMVHAKQIEAWFISLGYYSRIHFNQKLSSIKYQDQDVLEELFPTSLLTEKFPDFEYEHINVANRVPHEIKNDTEYRPGSLPFDGKVIYLSGPLIVVENSELHYVDTRNLSNREIKRLSINQEVIL